MKAIRWLRSAIGQWSQPAPDTSPSIWAWDSSSRPADRRPERGLKGHCGKQNRQGRKEDSTHDRSPFTGLSAASLDARKLGCSHWPWQADIVRAMPALPSDAERRIPHRPLLSWPPTAMRRARAFRAPDQALCAGGARQGRYHRGSGRRWHDAGSPAPLHGARHADLRHELRHRRLPDEQVQRSQSAGAPGRGTSREAAPAEHEGAHA